MSLINLKLFDDIVDNDASSSSSGLFNVSFFCWWLVGMKGGGGYDGKSPFVTSPFLISRRFLMRATFDSMLTTFSTSYILPSMLNVEPLYMLRCWNVEKIILFLFVQILLHKVYKYLPSYHLCLVSMQNIPDVSSHDCFLQKGMFNFAVAGTWIYWFLLPNQTIGWNQIWRSIYFQFLTIPWLMWTKLCTVRKFNNRVWTKCYSP